MGAPPFAAVTCPLSLTAAEAVPAAASRMRS